MYSCERRGFSRDVRLRRVPSCALPPRCVHPPGDRTWGAAELAHPQVVRRRSGVRARHRLPRRFLRAGQLGCRSCGQIECASPFVGRRAGRAAVTALPPPQGVALVELSPSPVEELYVAVFVPEGKGVPGRVSVFKYQALDPSAATANKAFFNAQSVSGSRRGGGLTSDHRSRTRRPSCTGRHVETQCWYRCRPTWTRCRVDASRRTPPFSVTLLLAPSRRLAPPTTGPPRSTCCTRMAA